MRSGLILTLVLAVLLAGCGGGAGSPTSTTGAPTSTAIETPSTAPTEAKPTPTTEAQATAVLPAGTVSFSGAGAFASPPFSLPGPSNRYIVETTAGRVGDGTCFMVVRIEQGGPFGAEDVYWWLTYTSEDGPSTETHTQELTHVSPSDQFRLVTEPEEWSDCTWTVTLRPD
jgi:glucose/arabinose dehydrogenase